MVNPEYPPQSPIEELQANLSEARGPETVFIMADNPDARDVFRQDGSEPFGLRLAPWDGETATSDVYVHTLNKGVLEVTRLVSIRGTLVFEGSPGEYVELAKNQSDFLCQSFVRHGYADNVRGGMIESTETEYYEAMETKMVGVAIKRLQVLLDAALYSPEPLEPEFRPHITDGLPYKLTETDKHDWVQFYILNRDWFGANIGGTPYGIVMGELYTLVSAMRNKDGTTGGFIIEPKWYRSLEPSGDTYIPHEDFQELHDRRVSLRVLPKPLAFIGTADTPKKRALAMSDVNRILERSQIDQ